MAGAVNGCPVSSKSAEGCQSTCLLTPSDSMEGFIGVAMQHHHALTQAAVLQLAEALGGVSHLRSLDLGGNDIKAEGIAALMKAIESHKELRQLELGYNVIGAEGAEAVANALKYNTTVRASLCLPATSLHLAGLCRQLTCSWLIKTIITFSRIPGR